MVNELDPVVGNWYRHLDKGQYFTIVAVNDADETIEIQHFDGDVEELDLADWPAQEIEIAEAPEDWTGPVDDVEVDDLPYTETEMSDEDWAEPLAELRADNAQDSEEPEPAEEESPMDEELREPRELVEGRNPGAGPPGSGARRRR